MNRAFLLLTVIVLLHEVVYSQRIIPCNEKSQFCGDPRSNECPQDTGRVMGAVCEDGSPCCFGVDPCLWTYCPPSPPPILENNED